MVLLLGAGIGLFAFMRSKNLRFAKLPKPTANRPDEEATYPLPVEYRSAVSDGAIVKAARPWTSEDQKRLEVLMRRILAGDRRSIDPDRFIQEMEALSPRLDFSGGKSHWLSQLTDSLDPPQLMEEYEILSARWTGANQARIFVWSKYYGEGDVYVYFVHQVDGSLRLYDWRETLEPTSCAQFYNATRVSPEQIDPFETVMGELERIYADEEIDLETSAEGMLEAVLANPLTGAIAAHAQHYAASYLVAVEASPAQLERLTGRMAIGEFGGAALWKAIACRDRDPEAAYRYCITALKQCGWQPQLALEAIKASKSTGNVQEALPYIAISLERMPEIVFAQVCEFESDSVKTVIEAWRQRAGPSFEDSLLTAIETTSTYALNPSCSEPLKEALFDAAESKYVRDVLKYRLEQRETAEQYALLSRLCSDPQSQRFDSSLIRDFLAAAVESERVSDAMSLLDGTGREMEDVEAALADLLLPAYQEEEYSERTLGQLKSAGFKSILLRALILDNLGRESEALAEIASFGPAFNKVYSVAEQAEQESLQWYFARAVSCAADLVIRLKPADKWVETLSAFTRPHLQAETLLASEFLARREFEKLDELLQGDVEFRSVFEAHQACATASELAGNAVSVALQDLAFGGEDEFSSMGAYAVLRDFGEDPYYVRDNLVALVCKSGLAPELWKSSGEKMRERLVEDYLVYSVVDADIPEQSKTLRSLLTESGFGDTVLFHELDAAIATGEQRYFDAAVASLEESEHYRYAADADTFRTLCNLGIVERFDEVYAECPNALKGDAHEKWRELASQLSHGGDASLDLAWIDPSFVNYNPAVQFALAQAGQLRNVSQNAAVWLQSDACSIVLGSPKPGKETTRSVASAFSNWIVQDTRNFPGATAVWTRDTKQGFLVAATYNEVPPGLDPDAFPASAETKTYLAIAISPKTPGHNAKRLLHRFVKMTFGGTGDWPEAYSIEDSVTWPTNAWQSAMAGFVSGKTIPMQLRDIRSGNTRRWKRYRMEPGGGNYGLQFSAIVEHIACKPSQTETELSSEQNTFVLSEPSLVMPIFTAGTHVR
ncbi:MAG TPA: hypothetical protein DDW52_18340 [Planctomycetaceae bacterium]|nr:hypothetical protein [Planctomycetaceae bacterium]